MALDRVHRRLATILAADAVGYSRLIGRDEEGTLATLRAHRQIIDRLIEQHEGRVFGSAGDSVIAEFASPVEAVRCATEIQLEVDKQNAELPEPSRLRFRIGINLGDVVVEGDNLMGDGVNVAARLEALSHPGGICISEAVYAQARDRLSLEFVDLGEHRAEEHRPACARLPRAPPFGGTGHVALSRSRRLRVRKRRPLLRPSAGDCRLHRTAGAASCQRQGIPAHLWDERFRQVLAPARRAAAFHHSARRSGWHQFLAPLSGPPVRGA